MIIETIDLALDKWWLSIQLDTAREEIVMLKARIEYLEREREAGREAHRE